MSTFAYLRISTHDQTHDSQRQALAGTGLEIHKEFVDTISGSTTSRPALDEMLSTVRRGDTIVVYRLDRLGRSMQHLVNTVLGLAEKDITVRSLNEQIDTGTVPGRMMLSLMAGMAELERENIRERTRAGLAATRARGTRLGAPREALVTRGRAGLATQTEARKAAAEGLRWVIEPMAGTSHSEAARLLNERGIPSAMGGAWRPQAVRNLRARLEL